MLTKIKQFVFYLSYELSLFQKVSVGLLGIAVAGFLGMQATALVANLSGNLLKGSVTEGTGTPTASATVLSIMSVDQSGLAANGSLSVKYALSNKPDTPFKFVLSVSSNEAEVGKGEAESSEQSGVVTAQIDGANRSAASFTVRITGEGAGQSLSDTVTVVSSGTVAPNIPPVTSSGAIVDPLLQSSPAPSPTLPPFMQTGSGSLPPGFGQSTTNIPVQPQVGSGSAIPSSPAQCIAIGRSCSLDTDCCSQRCAQINVGDPKVKVCLPKR